MKTLRNNHSPLLNREQRGQHVHPDTLSTTYKPRPSRRSSLRFSAAWLLRLSLSTGAALLQAQSVVQFSAATYNVTEGTPEVAILLQRANDLDTIVSVDFATLPAGSATAGADYVEGSSTLTFLANETNKTVRVPILNDGAVEAIETIQVILTNATVGAVLGVRSNATVRITDNDKGLAFEFANYWAPRRRRRGLDRRRARR